MNRDIRISVGLPRHPKMVKLTRKVGESAFRCLITLWCFAAENRPNGNLGGMDEMDIAIASGWSEDGEDKWVGALISCGFIDQAEDGLRLHDWEDNNPWAAGAEQRSEKAKNAAKARYAKRNDASGSANGTDEQCSEQDPALPIGETGNPPSPTPSPSPSPPHSSEADASGGSPPDLKLLIFGPFLEWLANQTGKPKDSLRAALGRQCKLYGDAVVIEIANRTQREAPVDPLAWMERAFQYQANGGTNQRRAPRQAGEIV